MCYQIIFKADLVNIHHKLYPVVQRKQALMYSAHTLVLIYTKLVGKGEKERGNMVNKV